MSVIVWQVTGLFWLLYRNSKRFNVSHFNNKQVFEQIITHVNPIKKYIDYDF